jgi:HAD superfamily hydrolase (TIGR01509 family)
MSIRGIVFDFDGLILDTETPIFRAWQESFVEHGCDPMTIEEWSAEIGTVRGLDVVGLLQTRATRPVDLDAMHERRRARHDELIAAEEVRPGVIAWLDEADELGLGVAIASSSSRDWVEQHLDRLALRSRFSEVACYGPGRRAKPAPDVYVAACAAMEVEPAEAVAVEDSPHGIAAAKAAGLRCIAVPNDITAELDLSRADLEFPSLAASSLRDALGHLGLAV